MKSVTTDNAGESARCKFKLPSTSSGVTHQQDGYCVVEPMQPGSDGSATPFSKVRGADRRLAVQRQKP